MKKKNGSEIRLRKEGVCAPDIGRPLEDTGRWGPLPLPVVVDKTIGVCGCKKGVSLDGADSDVPGRALFCTCRDPCIKTEPEELFCQRKQSRKNNFAGANSPRCCRGERRRCHRSRSKGGCIVDCYIIAREQSVQTLHYCTLGNRTSLSSTHILLVKERTLTYLRGDMLNNICITYI